MKDKCILLVFIKPATLFIHLAVCLTTGPKHAPKRVLNIVRSRASSFRSEYPLLSLRSSSSFLHLLPRLPVTYIPPFILPSITCRRRQFLRKMWPIQLALRLLRYSSAPWLISNTSQFLTWSVQPLLLPQTISSHSPGFHNLLPLKFINLKYDNPQKTKIIIL
jgi:hypothetical protein